MKYLFSTVISLALTITACAPSETAIQTAMAQTQAALTTNTPEPTATPIPFAELNLDDLLVTETDLLAGATGAEVNNILPEMFSGIAEPEYKIFQRLQRDGMTAGGVTVVVYNDEVSLNTGYQFIADGMGTTNHLEGTWERGEYEVVSFEVAGLVFDSIDLVIAQCNAVVHIRLSDANNEHLAITYAERLIKRLSPFVCR